MTDLYEGQLSCSPACREYRSHQHQSTSFLSLRCSARENTTRAISNNLPTAETLDCLFYHHPWLSYSNIHALTYLGKLTLHCRLWKSLSGCHLPASGNTLTATMSLNPKVSPPVAGGNGGQVPAPLSRLILLQQTVSQPVFAAFLAGGVAGAVSRTVVSPLERLKILFQIQTVGREEYKLSVGQGLKKMWKDEGWRGYMRGNGTNCIRIVPYSAVQFGSYNFYKRVCCYLILPTSKATSSLQLTDSL